ncbi:MAG TPA: alkaline phosphatase PhoX [Acidimicrobiia bacterium]|jgi:secreted PhoX family phosphatase
MAGVTRRDVVRAGIAASALVATARWSDWWRPALAAPAEPGLSPFGPLSDEPDVNGIFLPDGFTSRVVAVSDRPVIPASSYEWHPYPDGGATFPTRGGGWIYVSNSETGDGGVGALRFDARGRVVDAYRILDGTSANCAGGPTPWGTWLSCEERPEGHVWECDPRRAGQGIERPALGTFTHEAAAVDPVGRAVYLTEDHPDGRLYRFVPTAYPDLTNGSLQAAAVGPDGTVTWTEAGADAPQRGRDTTGFDGGEGMFYDRGTVVFTTKGDGRVWALDVHQQALSVVYDSRAHDDPPLTGLDNITVHPRSGDLFVAEDGGNLELCVISRPGRSGASVVASFARVAGPPRSEITGPAFTRAGNRLYFSSQRGTIGSRDGAGITYEIRGPFVNVVGSRSRPAG